MKKKSVSAYGFDLLILLILTMVFFSGSAVQNANGTVYVSTLTKSFTNVTQPSVILENGTVGNVVIYTNDTGGRISVEASVNSSLNYDYVLKVFNQVTDSWKIRLRAYSQSNIGRLTNCTIYFHNASNGSSRQIYIQNGAYINETGPLYDLQSSPAEKHIAIALQVTDSTVSIINVYLEILVPNRTTYAQYAVTFEIT